MRAASVSAFREIQGTLRDALSGRRGTLPRRGSGSATGGKVRLERTSSLRRRASFACDGGGTASLALMTPSTRRNLLFTGLVNQICAILDFSEWHSSLITRPRAPGSGFVGRDEAPRPAAASFRALALPDPASSLSSSPQPATSRRSRVYWTSSTPSPMKSSTPRRRRSEPRSCAPQRSARCTRA